MGMVVRTNTMALNAYRQLGMNNSAVAKSLEKLSSGFRINRAGDDAAGLAISEKMKAQITGLETASSNAQDGISLIQTAEGNLGEVHDMLNRMVELATKSANGTYTNIERKALQDEVDQLLTEIDRISQSANFNGTRLLDGSMGLNKGAFTVLDNISSTKAGALTIPNANVTVTHTGQKSVEVKTPAFSVDFADYTTTGGKVAMKVNDQDVEVWNATDNKWEKFEINKTTGGVSGTDVAAALDNKDVRIGTTVYSTAKATSGTGANLGVTFTYKGFTEDDDAATATTVDADGSLMTADKVDLTPISNVALSSSAATFAIDNGAKDIVKDVTLTTTKEGAVTFKYEAVTAGKASGTTAGTFAGAQSATAQTASNTDILNGKKLTVVVGAAAVTSPTAAMDADGNVTVTLAGDDLATDYATATAMQTAISTALGTLTGTDDATTAWKAVTVTITEGTGTYAVPAAGDTLGEMTLQNGVSANGWKVTVTDADNKTGTASGNGTLANDAELTFTGDVTGSLKVADAATMATKTNNTALGTQPKAVTVSDTGRVNCPIYDVQDGVVGNSGERAGVTLKLTAEMIAAGNTLKIEDKTFTFVAEGKGSGTNGAAGAGEIALNYDSGTNADRLAKVTAYLSQTVQQTANFTIGRSKDAATIELEEKVPAAGSSTKGYTAEQLRALFSGTTAGISAGSVLKISNNQNINIGDALTFGDHTYKFVEKASGAEGEVVKGADSKATLKNLKTALESDGYTATVDETAGTIKISNVDPDEGIPMISGGGLTLQIGDTADPFNKMSVAVANMSTNGLGLDGLKRSGIMSESSASNAIDTIKKAINSVSSTRAGLGALQNRLEHTINNLDVAAENLSAANSRIRDTDMAKEMMNYTKMNVLVQSAQAMLAQANQQPQSVLQLLQ